MPANRIMIVEDEGIIAMDIRHQLEGFGYEVVAMAFSGEQAVMLATEHRPDLIMMDIVLKGGMDGVTAAQTITKSLNIPVIFLTAYSDPATLLRAKAVGAHGYLIKPFRPDELHSSIEVALYKHQLERKLKESEQWFAKTLHCISDGVIATDAGGNIQFMNPVAEAATGWRLEQAKGKNAAKLMTLLTEDRASIENPIPIALKTLAVTTQGSPVLLVSQTGVELPIDDGAAPILDNDGALLGAVMVFRDITERRRMENSLRESEERFHSAFDLAAIGMALVTVDGRFLQVNSSLCTIFGYSGQELLTSGLQMLTHDNTYDEVLGHHLRQLLGNELPSFQIEMKCHHKIPGKRVWVLLNAALVRNLAHEPRYFIIQIQDISERKDAEQKLVYIAIHDPLTGLLNRAQFQDRFTQTLFAVRRHNAKLALIFLDLDRFKFINDTLGHRIGNLLLQAVGERLKKMIRINDSLARLGGDEFIALLSDIHQIGEVARIAQKIIEALAEPFTLEDNDIAITASIGISVYPDDGETCHALMTNADTAMYMAKERGKNNYQFYTLEMTAKSLERMTIEKGLRHALMHYGLKLHYQPLVDVAAGHAVGAEALVRWQHPEWGLVYPEQFMAIAEDTGLIVSIGAWVLRTACLQARTWQENDGPFTQVAVNISARQFLEPDFFQSIKAVLDETGLKPSSLGLEITEPAIMQDLERALLVLQQLHGLGVRLGIDNFGRGYSSLNHLRRFPIQSVKIDRSFIRDIPGDEENMNLVRAIIALAHELKLMVMIAGVETEAQLAFLKAWQCDRVQGHLFSRPMTAEQLLTDFNPAVFKTLLSG